MYVFPGGPSYSRRFSLSRVTNVSRQQVNGEPKPLGYAYEGRNRVNEAWGAARERSGVDARGWHDLRHHYASVLIGAGCSIRAVQDALGHSNASETLDTYSHLRPSDEDRVREALDGAMRIKPDAAKRIESPVG